MGAVEPAVFEVPVRRMPTTAECEIRAGSLAVADPVEIFADPCGTESVGDHLVQRRVHNVAAVEFAEPIGAEPR